MIRYIGFIVLCILFLCSSCSDKGTSVYGEDQLIMVGDSLIWSTLDYDDSEWSSWVDDLPGDKVFWVRNSEIFPNLDTHKQLGIHIISTGACQVYWDGVYLGDNGTLGIDNQKEVPGNYIHQLLLPDSLAQVGKHVLALRCTQAHDREYGHRSIFYVDDFYEIVTGGLQISKYMFFIGGIFFMAGLYFFFIFIANKNDFSFLIFSVICFVFLGLLLLEYYKLFYFYPYTFQLRRMQIIGYLHVALSFLIPIFFAIELKFPWKRYLLGVILLGVIIIQFKFESFDYAAILQNRLMWILSLLIVLYSCFKQMREAFIVLVGFLGSYLVFYFTPYLNINTISNYDVSIFASFVCIILSMLYIISYQRKEQRKAYEASLVVSERLKNELLKKNIKPHFIMNTLTSLIDWVEDSPKDGVKFIHALADEFDILNEIADHKLVPIGQEIKLCENHLKVMGFRKEIKYKWIQNGIDQNEIIPPAILHTVLENGVTHSKPNSDGEIIFILNYAKDKKKRAYTLLVKAEIDQSILTAESKNITIGTGTKYIKSRLQESYGSDWEYESKATEEGWLTTITILK